MPNRFALWLLPSHFPPGLRDALAAAPAGGPARAGAAGAAGAGD